MDNECQITPAERQEVMNAHFMCCAVCEEQFKNFQSIEIHHGGEHDTIGANQNHPIFTQSCVNKFPMHKQCHQDNPGFGRMDLEKIEIYEQIFQLIKKVKKSQSRAEKRKFIADIKLITMGS